MHKTPGQRTIRKIWKSEPTIEGAGVHLRRAFGFHELPLLDPFLLLDDFRSENPADYKAGFPWHPHRGIETISNRISGISGRNFYKKTLIGIFLVYICQ